MTDNKIFRILAAILAFRAKYWDERGEYAAAVAYDNAFDMLVYALNNDWDCLRQFGWADEAEEILDRYDDNLDLDTIKAIINQ